MAFRTDNAEKWAQYSRWRWLLSRSWWYFSHLVLLKYLLTVHDIS